MISVSDFIEDLESYYYELLVKVEDDDGDRYTIDDVLLADDGESVFIISTDEDFDSDEWTVGDIINQLESYDEDLEVKFQSYDEDGDLEQELELYGEGCRTYDEDEGEEVYLIQGS